MSDATPHRLYWGQVFHKRTRPLVHGFSYRVFSCLLDIDQLDRLPVEAKGFGYNRFGLLSFYDRDHGSRDGGALRPWVEEQLARQGLEAAGTRILLLCYPRLFGYVFNPLSVYYCFDCDGALKAMIYEVKNTFGEQHTYVCGVEARADGKPDNQSAEKQFHVSPFIDLAGSYTFRFRAPNEHLSLQIRHEGPNTLLLTGVTGTARALNTGNLYKSLLRFPLMTFKVIAAIHFEAFRLWRKGAKVYQHPKHARKAAGRAAPAQAPKSDPIPLVLRNGNKTPSEM